MPVPGPVSPRMSAVVRRSSAVFTFDVALAMQALCSRVGLPSHDILVASKRAPGALLSGPSAASRAMIANTVPSFGAAA